MRTPSRHVVGVDFGTLSGRAVVVRVEDGAELGSAVHEYADGVVDRRLPATGEALPPDWALQMPADWRAVLQEAVPAALAASGVDPSDRHRHRHRLHRLHGAADDVRRHAAVRAGPLAFAGRTPTPSCGSTTPPSRTPTGSTRWPSSAASRGWPATAGGSPASGSSPRRCSCWRRTPRSTPRPSAGWRRPTGSSGSSAAPTSATPAPPATRASTRTGATRRGTTSRR